jgi:hypothetical protein
MKIPKKFQVNVLARILVLLMGAATDLAAGNTMRIFPNWYHPGRKVSAISDGPDISIR